MSELIDRCHVCNARDVHSTHVQGCEDARDTRAEVTAHAIKRDIPAVAALDLMAHLKRRVGETTRADAVVHVLIDLGWRPVIGDVGQVWTRPVVAKDRRAPIAPEGER